MFRPTLALVLLAGTAALAHAQSLHGKVEGRTYASPTGQFRVTIPVLAELGGDVTDTPNVVTFQDDFNTHVSIAAFPQDATQRWEMNTRERKDYLVYFFSNFVLADFRQTFEGVKIESAKFLPGAQDGSLLAYLLVPGGSMFASRVPQIAPDPLQVAKRGNLLFVRNGHVFIISTELAERVIEGKSYGKKTEEEDEILRNRLLDVLSKMTFPKVAAPAPAAADAKK
ncbi:MAG: hypothetical protein JNL39_02210 [Opitutaceae bacterium]|nr:hypothetical protein [Opitutaceae bacterium]